MEENESEPNRADASAEQAPAETLPAADAASGPQPETATAASAAQPQVGDERVGAAPSGRALRSAGLVLALVLALLAATLAGFLWWQYRQFYVVLDSADADTARGLETARASLRRAEDRIDDLAAMLETNRAALASREDRVEQLSAQLAATGRRMDALQGSSSDARAQWLRSQAEYYLVTATTELEIGDRWENAINALELADRTLAGLADPAFAAVREAIADELIALRAVRLPDIDGLIFSLDRLAERVDALPLRRGRARSGDAPSAGELPNDAEPGLARLWQSIKRAFGSIVRVERTGEPVAMPLSDQESRLVRAQTALELELAQVAALRSQPQTFAAGLESAIDLLQRNFDTASGDVEGAVALLEQTRALDIAPAKPDIGESLRRLRAAADGAD